MRSFKGTIAYILLVAIVTGGLFGFARQTLAAPNNAESIAMLQRKLQEMEDAKQKSYAEKDRVYQLWLAAKQNMYDKCSWGNQNSFNADLTDASLGTADAVWRTNDCTNANREEQRTRQAFRTAMAFSSSIEKQQASYYKKLQELQSSPNTSLSDEEVRDLNLQTESVVRMGNEDQYARAPDMKGAGYGMPDCDLGAALIPGSESNFDFAYCVNYVFALIAYAALSLASWFLSLAGLLFDYVIKYTVLEMAARVSDLTVIGEIWALLRDIVNIVFIFVLLYIGIKTILGINSEDTKKLIRNIVIMAILVNFSLFFAKVIIDASNMASVGFYKSITGDVTVGASEGARLADRFVRPMGLTSIFNANEGDGFASRMAEEGFWHIVIMGVGGSMFIMLVVFTFLYASVLFVIRFVAVIFAFIFSGIAFMSWILPQTKKYWSQWWELLLGQAIFAPLYLFMIYFVLLLNEQLFMGLGDGAMGNSLSDSLAQTPESLKDQGSNLMAPVLKFLIIIGLLNAATALAKSFASKGSSRVAGFVGKGTGVVDRWRNRLQSAAWRNTGGRGAAAVDATVGRVARAIPLVGGVYNNTVGAVTGTMRSAPGADPKLGAKSYNQAVIDDKREADKKKKETADQQRKDAAVDKTKQLIETIKTGKMTPTALRTLNKDTIKKITDYDEEAFMDVAGMLTANQLEILTTELSNKARSKMKAKIQAYTGTFTDAKDFLRTNPFGSMW